MANMPSTKTNPQAAFIIWNYEERTTADSVNKPHEIEEIYLNTNDVISINTSKSKSQPSGAFEVRLAPTLNWTAKLTPGSWCVILMSRDEIPALTKENDSKSVNFGNPNAADRRLIKMFGRITSSRLSVDVDQETGARKSQYIVTGEDWGSVFNARIYIDPILRNNNFDQLTAIGEAERLFFDKLVIDYLSQSVKLPSAGSMVRNILGFWGSALEGLDVDIAGALGGSAGVNSPQKPLTNVSAAGQYRIPSKVANYFGFKTPANVPTVGIKDIVKVYQGVLSSYDTYSGDKLESFGFPNPTSFYGVNTVWQMLTDNSNNVLNELVADMRWEGDEPKLALYHRIRPFLVRSKFQGADDSIISSIRSYYKDVRRTTIPMQDIISINVGTNLNEKVNFIDVKPTTAFLKEAHSAEVKLESQTYSIESFERDGFRPMMFKTQYLPFRSSDPKPTDINAWKYLLREWHFNKDIMLNGAMSFIGISEYIGVGDNIMVDSRVLGTEYNKPQIDSGEQPTFLLAHVEQIRHDFTVNDITGARSFVTTIRFVRGIITDENGAIVGDSLSGVDKFSGSLLPTRADSFSSGGLTGALDKKASSMTLEDELTSNVHKGKTKHDPGGGN